jgi:hypothetical protein
MQKWPCKIFDAFHIKSKLYSKWAKSWRYLCCTMVLWHLFFPLNSMISETIVLSHLAGKKWSHTSASGIWWQMQSLEIIYRTPAQHHMTANLATSLTLSLQTESSLSSPVKTTSLLTGILFYLRGNVGEWNSWQWKIISLSPLWCMLSIYPIK